MVKVVTLLSLTTFAGILVAASPLLAASTPSGATSTGGGIGATGNTSATGKGVGASVNTNANTPAATTNGGVGTSINPGANSSNTTSPIATDASGANIWESQNRYWKDSYASRPYYNSSRDYNSYAPAYRYGVDLYNKNPNKSYDDLDQSELNKGWSQAHGNSNLDWNDAQQATRDAYNRMYENRTSTGVTGTANTGTK